jgi:cell division protein FtsB
MFKRIAQYLKKYRRFFTINLLALILLFSYSLYIHYELSQTMDQQQEIVAFIQSNVKDQNSEKIKTHAIAIQQKIDDYVETGNISIDDAVIKLYEKAVVLAKDGNKLCYILEDMADGMLSSYIEGMKDGHKTFLKGRTQS